MFLEHLSASNRKGKSQSNQNKNPGAVVSGNLSTLFFFFFHSIVLIEMADCTVKAERRGSKQEMLRGLFFYGRTQHKQPEFQSFSAPREEIKPCGYKVSWGYLLSNQTLALSAPYIRTITYHTSLDKAATPTVGNQITATAQVLSTSETSFLVRSKALPYSHMMPFKDLFNSRLLRHSALASQKKEVIQDN